MAADRIIVCHACPHRQRQCAGPCLCSLDGRDILNHARDGQCPEGRFAGSSAETPASSTPRAEWPLWASKVAEWAEPPDKGVGDTIQRKLGVCGEAFKATLKVLGVECGCAARQSEWNAKYPYEVPA